MFLLLLALLLPPHLLFSFSCSVFPVADVPISVGVSVFRRLASTVYAVATIYAVVFSVPTGFVVAYEPAVSVFACECCCPSC